MASSQDILEVVDEIADDADPIRIENEAERLGLPVDKLLEMVVNEIKARIE